MNFDEPPIDLRDPNTFNQVYDHFFKRIYNYVYFRCHDPDLADDLTALVFERAFRHSEQYDSKKGALSPWIFAIARNVIIDHWRRAGRFKWISLDFLMVFASPRDEPENQVIAREEEGELLAALQTLKAREQDILSLKFGGRLTNRQIAEVTGLGENHIAVLIYRAVGKMRKILTKDAT